MAERRKSLPSRVILRFRRDLRALAQWLYLYFYAAPLLRYRGELGEGVRVAYGHGALLLLSERGFVKLAISSLAALDQEYANYCRLGELRPDLADALPDYRRIRWPGVSALVCERLNRIPANEALVHATAIYRRFRSNETARERLNLAECPQVAAGLRCVELGFGAKIAFQMQGITEAFLAQGQYTVGLAHGDFHSRNIMCDEFGQCRLIDLDCVRLAGVAEFDALYFALEQVWSATGVLWTGILAESFASRGGNIAETLTAFGTVWSPSLGIAFLLDRIGQDFTNYGMHYEHTDLAMLIDAASRAID